MRGTLLLKRLLLFFWAAWFTIVLATNACDAAKAAGLLDDSWAFASGNFRFLCETTAPSSPPGFGCSSPSWSHSL